MTGLRTTVNGLSVEIGNMDASTSLLDLLRETLNLKGTKQGCGSGDCGACTVMIAAADGQGVSTGPARRPPTYEIPHER